MVVVTEWHELGLRCNSEYFRLKSEVSIKSERGLGPCRARGAMADRTDALLNGNLTEVQAVVEAIQRRWVIYLAIWPENQLEKLKAPQI